ncbi:MAG TPA: hypothetical protein DEH78_09870 [Solibacterales bacterium]|nr:hypothetical protein [Bryobacterales bacterium]
MSVRYVRLAGLLICLCASLFAQSFNSSIGGTVSDPSGGSIPNATVTLRNLDREATSRVTTSAEGFYSFPNLASGRYELTIQAAGFKLFSQKNITLLLNQQVTVSARMEVGDATQTIEVTETAAQVNFTDAVRQEGVSGKELNELPLVVSGGPRSAANFTVLLPGVSTGGTNDAFNARINGGLQTGQEAIMDGVSMQQGTMSQSGMISFFDFRMTPDMVQEFKVLTSNYEPQYGASTSAQMIVETKSGTDKLRGGVFEYLRNEKLNARQFGADSRPIDKQHNFGGFLGGKLPFPWINRGNNQTYFYTDIEAFRATGGNNRPTLTVPTARMKRGDFGEWPFPVLDPATTRLNPNFNANAAEGPGNTRYLRDQFANNVIPTARIQNSLANPFLAFVPDPNRPGIQNNYQVPTPIPDSILANTNYYMARIDHNRGEKDRIYLTLWHQRAAVKFNSLFPQEISEQSFSDPQNSWVNRINWSHTFSPTLLNHWNAGYLNRNEGYGSINQGFVDKFPQIRGVAAASVPPRVSFGSDSYTGYGNSTGNNLRNITTRPTYITTNLTTWVKGSHTFKFGGEYRYLGQDFNAGGNEAGSFGFDRIQTGLVGIQAGNPIASFLLEQVNNANVDFRTVSSWQARAHALVFHFGDTWRANRKLSINYGLRWDIFTPSVEKEDRFSFFDPTGPNPAAGGRPGRLAFAGDNYGAASYGARYPEKLWWRGFAPRLGIAYALDKKTSIRLGYGMFFTQNYFAGWGGGMNLDGFNQNVSFSSTLGGIGPAFVLSQGFPQNFQRPPFIDPAFRNGRGTLYRAVEGNRRPYSQQWNFTVERELPGAIVGSVSYVANKGTRLPSSLLPINALNPSQLSLGSRLNSVFQPGQAELEGVRAPYAGWAAQLLDAGCQPSVAQALLPFPQFCTGFTAQNENAGNSTYHSAQFKAEKRYGAGLYLLAAYTWSRLITDVQSTNPEANTWAGGAGAISPFERQRNKGLAQDDVPHVFTTSFVYDLPFGPGRRFAATKSASSYLVGGWSVNLIQKWQAGTPLLFRSY